jgi:hypothetical protein
MRTTRRHPITLLASTLAILACTPPPPLDEPGAEVTPLEARRGRVVEPAVLWLLDEDPESGSDELYAGITVDTRGRFPERFRLRLDEPPPEEVYFRAESFLELVGDSGLQMATGFVVAAPRGAFSEIPREITRDERFDDDLVRGEEQEHVLVYLNQDVEPGPVADEVFGGQTPSAGYHLFASDGTEVPLDTRLRIQLFGPRAHGESLRDHGGTQTGKPDRAPSP